MRKVWVAILLIGVALLLGGAILFYTTAGSAYTADWIAAAGDHMNPVWSQRMYRFSLKLNPFDAQTRLKLAALYESRGDVSAAENLLRGGIEQYNTGADLYLALASLYVRTGSLESACYLLDSAPAGYVSMQLNNLRPKAIRAPASGDYTGGLTFTAELAGGTCWYRLNDARWTLYTEPVKMQPGDYTLQVLSVSEANVPSKAGQYRYTVKDSSAVFAPKQSLVCPFCGETITLGPEAMP